MTISMGKENRSTHQENLSKVLSNMVKKNKPNLNPTMNKMIFNHDFPVKIL